MTLISWLDLYLRVTEISWRASSVQEKSQSSDFASSTGITAEISNVLFLSGPVYTIPDHLRIESLFILDWGCVCTALHESDTLCPNNPMQLCSASAGGTKMDPVKFVLFRFTCKHRNPIRNAPKLRFDNRMVSIPMRLINCLTNR